MKDNNVAQIAIAAAFMVVLILLSDPFMLWMPKEALTTVLFIGAVLMGLWAGFIMKEEAGDERETYHRMNAGRVAYLSGIAVLTLALVVQGLLHDIDPWISFALGVMILAKLGSHLYFERYK